MSCARVIAALQDCQRKHKREVDFYCSHLTAAAGWCIFSGLCPAEVRAIEDCIGIGSSAGKAPIIPKRCQDRAALLEACIESKQTIAKARTERCAGPQPVGPPRGAAAGEAGGEGEGAAAAPKRRGRKPRARAAEQQGGPEPAAAPGAGADSAA
ncbi:hypothetical protein Rsub_00322 [Raphidocelis subcapitata]|uniref:Uncharacterized protein n=1 Tax=Raphidocelis subcapitata TaxID=307507 RepID=A0A2V0NK21_9CHLO|nr:hypothetical protein Rsub_00322 [Raphidocelis subcapitata]|eukprot:GBF87611.1 hypothetical protein Rsub_00322 [Raphidocelis subcapitata]